MSEHTPGPWKANGLPASNDPDYRLSCAVYAGEKPICTTDLSVGRYKALSAEEQDANARLIAAAPELLEALSDTLGALNTVRGWQGPYALSAEEADRVCAKAEKAIAKARGEATT
jgi:hypothetical protein